MLFLLSPRCFPIAMVPMFAWALAGWCYFHSHTAMAAEWYLAPQISLRTAYDDNVLLVEDPEDSEVSATATAFAAIGARAEDSDLNIKAGLSANRYSRQDQLDYDEIYLELSGFQEFTRSIARLEGRVARDSTLTGDIEGILTHKRVDRETQSLNPSWDYRLSEWSFLSLGLAYTNTSYVESDDVRLFDYDYWIVDSTISHQLNVQTRLLALVALSRYQLKTVDAYTDSYLVKLGVIRDFSQSTRGDFWLGVRENKSVFGEGGAEVTDSGTDIMLDAKIKKRLEATTLTGSLGRSISPTGFGYLYLRDNIRVSVDHDMTPTLLAAMSVSAFRDEAAAGDAPDIGRDYFVFDTKLRRRVSPAWTVEAGYRYRWQKIRSTDQEANSNTVFASVIYSLQQRIFTR